MTHNNTFELILNIVYETMPRDNLLNSACLELFEYVKRENIKPIIIHVVENYREKIKDIIYVDTFQNLMLRYDQMQGYGAEAEATLYSQEEATPTRNPINGGHRWQGVREMDAAEEEYFDASDDEEDEVGGVQSSEVTGNMLGRTGQLIKFSQQGKQIDDIANAPNGSGLIMTSTNMSPSKPLVDYPDDDDELMDVGEHLQTQTNAVVEPRTGEQSASDNNTVTPLSLSSEQFLERFSEKRRREEDDDDDELIKLSSAAKRRGSTASVASVGSTTGGLQLKRNFSGQSSPSVLTSSVQDKVAGDWPSSATSAGTGSKKISINLSMSSATQAVLKAQSQAAAGDNSKNNQGSSDEDISTRNDDGGGSHDETS